MDPSLQRFEISDSKLEHSNWRFPATIKTRPLRDLAQEDFLTHHKAWPIDRSYDSSTARFKLLVVQRPQQHARRASRIAKVDETALPIREEFLNVLRQQRWVSDEYEHLWRRDGGGSAALTSHGVLTFLLQTPRDGGSFCSLSLVNRERSYCGGVFVTDSNFTLDNLLAGQAYLNRHPKVPRDFAILPFVILDQHVNDTISQVHLLSRELTETEERIADGDISLADNGDYKLLNRMNLEHLRLQRRSNFELELAANLLKYLDEYHRLWQSLWEGGTSYIEEMREKIEQQIRYSEQVKLDLDVIPKRVKGQSKTIFNFIAQRDMQTNIELAKSSRKIAEEARRDNLLNIEIAKATAQVANETREDSAAMKTIAMLTLVFLPGTAVASFFGMEGVFNWDGDEGPLVSSYVWVYFAVTIPLTGFVIVAWLWWFQFSQQRHRVKHEQGLQDVEKELKLRTRSASGTW
ncbi:hypothetical protein MBLNU230_g3517t1 [Neophaeotheca triangularis]